MIEASEMKQLLRENFVEVIFEKADGTLRTMNCTLRPEGLPASDGVKSSSHSRPENVVVAWDVDAAAWKSFRIESVKSYTIRE